MTILPGIGYGGYIQLKEIVKEEQYSTKKQLFELKEGFLYVDGTPIQGLVVFADVVQITGIHHTSWEGATHIRSTGRIEPSLEDPFVYLSEPGKMSGWPEEAIRKEIGARVANTEVKLTIVIPIDRVWIKTSRNVVHFAISGIVAEEIIKLAIQRRAI